MNNDAKTIMRCSISWFAAGSICESGSTMQRLVRDGLLEKRRTRDCYCSRTWDYRLTERGLKLKKYETEKLSKS